LADRHHRNFGVGRGLTEGSDRWVAKTILTYAFPVEGKQDENNNMQKPPNMNSTPRQTSAIDARAIAGSW
jgi:hypothetical protein